MKRREFIAVLAGGAVAWPLPLHAQQARKLPTIGHLRATTASAQGQWMVPFAQRLRDLGWIEGRTVAIEHRWAEGRRERLAEIATELVRLKVDIIVTAGTRPVTRWAARFGRSLGDRILCAIALSNYRSSPSSVPASRRSGVSKP